MQKTDKGKELIDQLGSHKWVETRDNNKRQRHAGKSHTNARSSLQRLCGCSALKQNEARKHETQ